MALIADDPGTTSRLERSGSEESRARALEAMHGERDRAAGACAALETARDALRASLEAQRTWKRAGRGAEGSGEGSSPLDAAPGPGSRILGGQLGAPEDGPGDSMTSPPPISSFLRAPFALSLLLVVGAAIMPRRQQAHAQRRAFRVDARGDVR